MTNANAFPYSGPDLVWMGDADPLGAETTSEAQNLATDCYHWLLCLPGGNLDNIERGVGAMQYLSGTLADLQGLPGAIEADFIKDPRIVAVAASLQQEPDGSYLIQVEVQPLAGAVIPLSYQYTQAGGLVPS